MSKIALIEEDLVTGAAQGISGVTIPSSLNRLDLNQLRFDGSNIINVGEETQFYISEIGQKHINGALNRQPLTCSWDDKLIKEGNTWRVKTQDDIDQELIKQGEAQIDAVADQAYTKSVSRAARYERKGEQAQAYKEAGYPTPIDEDLFSFIKKESESRTITGEQMADLILLRAKQFSDYGSDIDAIRSDLSNAVQNATDEATKLQAIDDAVAVVQQKTDELLTLIAST